MSKVVDGFLKRQQREGQALAAASDIFSVSAVSGNPPWRYLLQYTCRSLVLSDDRVEEAGFFQVGLTFGPDHLSVPPEIPHLLQWLQPRQIFHPNVMNNPVGPQFLCIGDVACGTGIVEIAHRVYELISYQRFNSADGLNPDACAWVRKNVHRFPMDPRPLRRPPPLPATCHEVRS